jgi:hypothetical protein
MSVRREDKDGEECWWKPLIRHGQGQHWHKNLRARTTRFHKETACSVKKKKMFYINENIKMKEKYQSLPFLRKLNVHDEKTVKMEFTATNSITPT